MIEGCSDIINGTSLIVITMPLHWPMQCIDFANATH